MLAKMSYEGINCCGVSIAPGEKTPWQPLLSIFCSSSQLKKLSQQEAVINRMKPFQKKNR